MGDRPSPSRRADVNEQSSSLASEKPPQSDRSRTEFTSAEQAQIKTAVDSMDTLDAKINPGRTMSPAVEKDYKKLVGDHEQAPQSSADKEIAIAARTRMLEHQRDAGDRDKAVQSLTELMTKYPETKSHKATLLTAAHFDLAKDPTFEQAFAGANSKDRQRLDNFSKLNDREQKILDAALTKMNDAALLDPQKASAQYEDMIKANEANPQSHLNRHIARAARMRLLQQELNNGDTDGARRQAVESLKKYPETSRFQVLVSSVGALGISEDEGLKAAFIKSGGDMNRALNLRNNGN